MFLNNVTGPPEVEGCDEHHQGKDGPGDPERHRDQHHQGRRKVLFHVVLGQGQSLSHALQTVAKCPPRSGRHTHDYKHNIQIILFVLPPSPPPAPDSNTTTNTFWGTIYVWNIFVAPKWMILASVSDTEKKGTHFHITILYLLFLISIRQSATINKPSQ